MNSRGESWESPLEGGDLSSSAKKEALYTHYRLREVKVKGDEFRRPSGDKRRRETVSRSTIRGGPEPRQKMKRKKELQSRRPGVTFPRGADPIKPMEYIEYQRGSK